MQINPTLLGRRIGELRQALGLTQRQFAVLIGRSYGWVAKIEVGERYPNRQTLPGLAQALRTTPEALVAYTDWKGSHREARARRDRKERRPCRAFREARGVFTLPRQQTNKRRKGLYISFSQTALDMRRRVRKRGDLEWRRIVKLPIETAAEAGFILHVLDRAQCRVERLKALDMGLRLMIASGSSPYIYSGDQRRWSIRAQYDDVDLVVIPQVPFIGKSGSGRRADFIIGATWDGVIVWVDIEIDEIAHRQQTLQDTDRDADVPIETIRIPEERLLDAELFDDLMQGLRRRLLELKATRLQAA